jgi:hypothetical protein
MRTFFTRSAQTTVLFLVVVGILALALGGYFNFVSNDFNNLIVATQSWISSRFLAIQDFLTVPRDVIAGCPGQLFALKPGKFLYRGVSDRARPQPIPPLPDHR